MEEYYLPLADVNQQIFILLWFCMPMQPLKKSAKISLHSTFLKIIMLPALSACCQKIGLPAKFNGFGANGNCTGALSPCAWGISRIA